MEVKDLSYYKKCFLHLSRSGRRGERAPHKLVLLLAVFDRVEGLLAMGDAGQRMIGRNLIDLHPKLEKYFYSNWHEYVTSETFSPAYAMPFFHMENEPFWTLVLKKDQKATSSQSEATLYKAYEGAYIDAELMALLVNKVTREELRNFVVSLLSPDADIHIDELYSTPVPIVEEKKSHPQLSEEEIEKRFMQYMRDKGISESSVKKYALVVSHNAEVKEIIKKYTGKDSLFTIVSLDKLNQILQEIKKASFNVRGNNMYSVGVSHYIKYVASEEFQQSVTEESTDDNSNQYADFLNAFIRYNKQVQGPYADAKEATRDYIGKRSLGIKGVSLGVVIARKRCRTEIYIDSGNKVENKRIFDFYYSHKQEVEKEIKDIIWQRLDEKDASRIRVDKQLSFMKPEDKEKIFQFFITTTENFQRVFTKFAPEYANYKETPAQEESNSSSIWSKLTSIFHKK